MKKLFLTMAVIFSTLIASAQFMVVTTVNEPADEAEWGMDNFTDNLGVGYNVNDNVVVGIVKNGEDYDLFGRYLVDGNIYASVQAPTEEMTDNLTVGLGYSFMLWKGLCVEPNYTMGLKEDDDGEREGEFNIGLSYRF
jgi:opacity protein-like surface antigen